MNPWVDFVVVFAPIVDLHQVLCEIVESVIQNAQVEGTVYGNLQERVQVRYQADRKDGRRVCGVRLSLDDIETDEGRADADNIVAQLSEELKAADPASIEHVTKFYDPLLQQRNAVLADEIFEVEMRLREALSLIFLASNGTTYYDLVAEVEPNPYAGKDPPTEEQMRKALENEFFFLLFSDYLRINARKPLREVKSLIELLSQVADFGELQSKLLASTFIADERYADFLARLKPSLIPIEKVRNCVAHNRSVPHRVLEDYALARPALLDAIREFQDSVGEA